MKHVPRAGRKTLHLICQAHLDPVWLWSCKDGVSAALTTISSAVDRSTEIEAFKFTRSSAITYRWVAEMDPVLYARIKELIASKRWEPIGGWIEQPDCNLPSTESFVRQSLYGKDFFEREFGFDVRIGYNVDSFGHSGGFPQLLKKAGMDYYVFMRPQPHENSKVPPVFWWEGPDGSRVLALRVPLSYCQSPATTCAELEEGLRNSGKHHFPGEFDDGLFFLGVGNHGGGPTRKHLATISKLQQEDDGEMPLLKYSSVSDYFRALGRSRKRLAALPVLRGELQHHARGCYSAAGEIKWLNRLAERSLVTAETLTLLAKPDEADSRTALVQAWWRLLLNQFHDVLAGTCTEEVWRETMERYGSVITLAREMIVKSMHALARRVSSREESGSVLFAFNPLPWGRYALIQCDTFRNLEESREPITHLEDFQGRQIPIQWAKPGSDFGPHFLPWGKLSAVVFLPPMGYRAFRLISAKPKRESRRAIKIEGLRKNGLASIKSGKGTELLSSPPYLSVFADESDTWAHGEKTLGKEIGQPRLLGSEVVESGLHFSITSYHYRWKKSEIYMDFVGRAHSDAVEIRLRFNWQEKREILRLTVPTRLTHASTCCQVPGGVAFRQSEPGEEPCQDWVAIEGKIKGRTFAVCVANAGSYSYDLAGGNLRLILARSVPFAEHVPARAGKRARYLDQGWQERRFSIFGIDGAPLSQPLHRAAAELQCDAESLLDSGHSGTEPWDKSFLEVSPNHVVVTSWKASENGKGSILRLQETRGRAVTAKIRFGSLGKEASVQLGKWEIATIRVRLHQGKVHLERADFLEKRLD